MPVVPKKTCSKCGLEKPVTTFPKDKRLKDGYHSNCKACRKESREQKKLTPEQRTTDLIVDVSKRIAANANNPEDLKSCIDLLKKYHARLTLERQANDGNSFNISFEQFNLTEFNEFKIKSWFTSAFMNINRMIMHDDINLVETGNGNVLVVISGDVNLTPENKTLMEESFTVSRNMEINMHV
jgi:hypothetical protein